jgi:hypothetical protein
MRCDRNDLSGIRHGVDVEAVSVYEAAALALQALRASPWAGPIGPATSLVVEVCEPAVRHTVTVRQLQQWTESTAVSPVEKRRKDHVRVLLAPKAS